MMVTRRLHQVIGVIHKMFTHMFDGLETTYAADLAAIRAQYPSEVPQWSEEPCVIHWEEGMQMLTDAGIEAPGSPEDGHLDDLNTVQERALGALVKEKYATDLYFLDRFPTVARPFYTMPCPDNPNHSNSYDIFLRGEEICSGAQRIHDPPMLEK